MPSKPPVFGLTPSEVQQITDVLKRFTQVEKAVIFGSRALGTYKPGSDIDLALFGQGLDKVVTTISYTLNEETLLPYFFDVLDYGAISNPDLKDHVDRVGVVVYLKPN